LRWLRVEARSRATSRRASALAAFPLPACLAPSPGAAALAAGGSSVALGVREASRAAPEPAAASVTSTAAAIFSLVKDMVRNAPSVSAAACAETNPAGDCPAAVSKAAFRVLPTSVPVQGPRPGRFAPAPHYYTSGPPLLLTNPPTPGPRDLGQGRLSAPPAGDGPHGRVRTGLPRPYDSVQPYFR